MTTKIEPPTLAAHDTRDHAAMDSCLDCGYSLTGLPAGGDCPECGASIPHSIDVHGAGTLPAEVIHRVQRALSWYRIGIIGVMLSGVFIMPIAGLQYARGPIPVVVVALQVVLLLVPIGAVIVQQYAWWTFAAPASAPHALPWRGSRIVRGLTLLISASAAGVLITLGAHATEVIRVPDEVTFGIVAAVGALLVLRAMFGVRLIGQLATRLFATSLRRWARAIVRLYLGGFVLLTGAGLAARTRSLDPEGAVVVLSLIGAAILAILTIAAFVELGQLMTARQKAIRRSPASR